MNPLTINERLALLELDLRELAEGEQELIRELLELLALHRRVDEVGLRLDAL